MGRNRLLEVVHLFTLYSVDNRTKAPWHVHVADLWGKKKRQVGLVMPALFEAEDRVRGLTQVLLAAAVYFQNEQVVIIREKKTFFCLK